MEEKRDQCHYSDQKRHSCEPNYDPTPESQCLLGASLESNDEVDGWCQRYQGDSPSNKETEERRRLDDILHFNTDIEINVEICLEVELLIHMRPHDSLFLFISHSMAPSELSSSLTN